MKDIILKLIEKFSNPKTALMWFAIIILILGIYQGAVSIDEIIHWAGRVIEGWKGKVNVDL